MASWEVEFLKAMGFPETGNGVPELAHDLLYNFQPFQVGPVSQNRRNPEFPWPCFCSILPRSTKHPSIIIKQHCCISVLDERNYGGMFGGSGQDGAKTRPGELGITEFL